MSENHPGTLPSVNRKEKNSTKNSVSRGARAARFRRIMPKTAKPRHSAITSAAPAISAIALPNFGCVIAAGNQIAAKTTYIAVWTAPITTDSSNGRGIARKLDSDFTQLAYGVHHAAFVTPGCPSSKRRVINYTATRRTCSGNVSCAALTLVRSLRADRRR